MKCKSLFLWCLASAFTAFGETSRPNVILILADDLGFGDVQALNPMSKIPTPHMNQLAKEGMSFVDAHTNSSVCTPTRYGILTGRYCWRTKLKKGVLNGFSPALMDTERTTVADLLNKQGYITGVVGKWHLGLDFQFEGKSTQASDYAKEVKKTPLDYGFDESFILPGSLNMAPYIYVEGNKVIEAATERQPRTPHNISVISGGPKAPGFDFEAVVDVFNDKAIDFIERSADKKQPFFLYFPLTAPHKPVIPTKDFIDQSEHGIYGAFVMQVDDVLGRIQATLKKKGIKENTLIIMTSDNGSFMYRIPEEKPDHKDDFKVVGYHAKDHQSNAIYRGTKADIYEAGHRVPFIISWPAKVRAASVSEKAVCTTDIFATLQEITGGQVSHSEAEDSYSFAKTLTGQANPTQRPAIIHHSIKGAFAIREGDWKLIACSGSGGRQQPVGEPWDAYQLYHMKNDPSETKNVFADHPEVARRLKEKLKKIAGAD